MQDPEAKIGSSAGWTDLEGEPADATSILIKYTYYGDLDFDDIVDSNDYDLIDNAFAQQTGALGSNLGLSVPIPEPATIALLALGSMGLLLRRRKV